MTATKTTPFQRRLDAMGAVCNSTRNVEFPEDGSKPVLVWYRDFDDRAATATAIRTLAPLGRTDRWKGSIENWARFVETAETPESYRWSFDQYAIWTGYNAE